MDWRLSLVLLFVCAQIGFAAPEDALTSESDHFAEVRKHAESTPSEYSWIKVVYPGPVAGTTVPIRDWGHVLMSSAFVYRIEPTPERLQKIKEMLQASLDCYHAYYAASKAVNWYGRSRLGWLAAFDWVWGDLTPAERETMGRSMLDHVYEVFHKPNIIRRNASTWESGYYGASNLALFAGIVFLNEGIDDAKALEFLKRGYDTYQKLLDYRSRACGDDGGGASATVTYAFADYPWAEWSYLLAWEAATGEKLAPEWPHIGLQCNYMLWNWLPGNLEFGYGDVHHYNNRFPSGNLYAHMSHIMHLYADARPDLASLAAYVREKAGGKFHASLYGINPFLLTNLGKAPPPMDMQELPAARYFEAMGQVFMRSGSEPDATYALFACGGISGNHRHYDATHFTVYKQGFLALDTGTRRGNTDNLQNYYAQTVAHNCVLIKMPDEQPVNYWNGKVWRPVQEHRVAGDRLRDRARIQLRGRRRNAGVPAREVLPDGPPTRVRPAGSLRCLRPRGVDEARVRENVAPAPRQ